MMELLCAQLLGRGSRRLALTFNLLDEEPDLARLYCCCGCVDKKKVLEVAINGQGILDDPKKLR